MKLFKLDRTKDISGVSGTGIVAEGVIFSNGKVSLCWLGDKSTIVIYDNIKLVEQINCHNGNTKIIYYIILEEFIIEEKQ